MKRNVLMMVVLSAIIFISGCSNPGSIRVPQETLIAAVQSSFAAISELTTREEGDLLLAENLKDLEKKINLKDLSIESLQSRLRKEGFSFTVTGVQTTTNILVLVVSLNKIIKTEIRSFDYFKGFSENREIEVKILTLGKNLIPEKNECPYEIILRGKVNEKDEVLIFEDQIKNDDSSSIEMVVANEVGHVFFGKIFEDYQEKVAHLSIAYDGEKYDHHHVDEAFSDISTLWYGQMDLNRFFEEVNTSKAIVTGYRLAKKLIKDCVDQTFKEESISWRDLELMNAKELILLMEKIKKEAREAIFSIIAAEIDHLKECKHLNPVKVEVALFSL